MPCLGAAVILASAWRFHTAASVNSFRKWASRTEVVLGKDRFSKRQAMLARLGFLPVSRFYTRPGALGSDTKAARKLFGAPCSEPSPERFNALVPPSTSLLPSPPPSVPPDTAIISLVCGARELFDRDHGIIVNAGRRGRNWERPAWATVTLGDGTVLEQPVGLRVHGGTSRKAGVKSFRLVFHRRYAGEPESPPGVFFGPDTPRLKSVVLMSGERPQRVAGALMLELAARTGCLTSRVRPAVVYLNGTLIPAPYFIVEHQTRHFLETRQGLRNFDFHRLKAERGKESRAFKDFHRRAGGNAPLDMEAAADLFDLDNLTAWGFLISFGVVADNNQGAYFRDRATAGAPWLGLTWDLDGVLRGWDGVRDRQGGYDFLSVPKGDRGRLLQRLMADSPEYRRRFIRFAMEQVRGPFSTERMEPLLARYNELTDTHPGSYPRLKPELHKVFDQLRRQGGRYLDYLERTYPADHEAVAREMGAE